LHALNLRVAEVPRPPGILKVPELKVQPYPIETALYHELILKRAVQVV